MALIPVFLNGQNLKVKRETRENIFSRLNVRFKALLLPTFAIAINLIAFSKQVRSSSSGHGRRLVF